MKEERVRCVFRPKGTLSPERAFELFIGSSEGLPPTTISIRQIWG